MTGGFSKHSSSVVTPFGPAEYNWPVQPVYIGYHPIAGSVGETVDVLWKDVTSPVLHLPYAEAVPDPTYHWAVLVGDFYHELAISSGKCFYQNGWATEKGVQWRVTEVGRTTWNDVAIVDAARSVMNGMDLSYSLFSNNCQRFSVGLVRTICLPESISSATLGTIENHISTFKESVVDRVVSTVGRIGGGGLTERVLGTIGRAIGGSGSSHGAYQGRAYGGGDYPGY